MHSNTLILALGFTLAATTSAAPLLELAPTARPLFTPVCCRVNASTATGVANVTAGESPSHEHTPDCEHNYKGKPNTTNHHAYNPSTEPTSHSTEGKGYAAKATGNPSPYPGFNASAYAHHHTAHNHTGAYCNHPSHRNTTDTGAPHDPTTTHHQTLNASANPSSQNHTAGRHCAHPSHHNATTTTAGHTHGKKAVLPRTDVTVCLGADCQDTQVVTAEVDSAGELTGVVAKKGERGVVVLERRDGEMSYEDVARQMSGAGIAGGM